MANGTWNCYDVKRSFGGDLQAAVNEAISNGGGLIYLAAGDYDLTDSLYLPFVADRNATPLTFLGDGPLRTRVRVKTGYTPFHLVIVENAAYTRFVGIHFEGCYDRGTPSDPADINKKWVHGLIVGPSPESLYAGTDSEALPTRQLIQLSMEQCIVDKVGGYAVYVRGDITGWPPTATSPPPQFLTIQSTFQNCELESTAFVDLQGRVPAAVYIEPHNTTLSFRDCFIHATNGRGIYAWGCAGLALQDCRLRAEGSYAALEANQSINGQVRHCVFEDAGTSATPAYFIRLVASCHGWTFEQCAFQRSWSATSPAVSPRVLQVASGDACRSIVLLAPNLMTQRAPAADDWIKDESEDSSVIVIGGSARASVSNTVLPLRISTYGTQSAAVGGASRFRTPTQLPELVDTPDTGDLIYSAPDGSLLVYLGSAWAKIEYS